MYDPKIKTWCVRCCLTALMILATLTARARADELPRLPTDFGSCPRDTEGFLRYIVQRRAAEGLNGMVVSEKDPRANRMVGTRKLGVGTIFGGGTEDLNVAWVAAAAYEYPWSRFHHDAAVRARAFLLMDSVMQRHADGVWDDGGLNAYFGLHSLAWAALEWIETGDVDAPRAAAWRQAVAKTADQTLICLQYGPYRPSGLTGQYANPEMEMLSGLAAAWKLTGEKRYRDEAAKALRRYDAWLFDGGGVAYFLRASPQHGYQQMVVKSVALYWDLTADPYALEFLKRLAPYYPNVQHRSGFMTDAEQSQVKHYFFNFLNPGVPAMLACELQDGNNREAADIATRLTADNVDNLHPSFPIRGWYNYQSTTYAAAALRLLRTHTLPPAVAMPAERVFLDRSFMGVRSHWDDFTAAVGTRPMNDSLAGAYLTDPAEPAFPLGAAVDGVYFEVCQGKQPAALPTTLPTTQPAAKHWKTEFRCVEWTPTVDYNTAPGLASVSCFTRLCAPYWGDIPSGPGDEHSAQGISDWVTIQHWAVWRDQLIGLGMLRCDADGGSADGKDVVRVRWRLAPVGRKMQIAERTESACRFQYGGLKVDLERLDQRGGFAFSTEEIGQPPQSSLTPVLSRAAPWSRKDFVHVATVIRPAGAEGSVSFKSLGNAAAAVLLEPGGRKATAWVVNLERHFQQVLLDVPPGATIVAYKHCSEMPGVPPGEPANLGLLGSESATWTIESPEAIDPKALLAHLRAGKSR
jgi:hypothetical protein